MKPGLILFSLFFFQSIASPGYCKIEWMDGSLSLISGETFRGEVSYNGALDIISFKKNETIKSYTAIKVKDFQYYDEDNGIIRKYISLKYMSTPSTYNSRIFFEILIEGDMMMLYRDNNEGYPMEFRSPNEYPFSTVAKHVARHSYFAYFNGQFINLKKFSKEVMPFISKRFEDKINTFIIDNDLNINKLENQLVVVDYFNHLVDPNHVFASMDISLSFY